MIQFQEKFNPRDSHFYCGSGDLAQEGKDTPWYRQFSDNAFVGLFRVHVSNGRVVDCNDLLAHWAGYQNRRDFLAEQISIDQFFSLKSKGKMWLGLRERGLIENFETQARRPNGTKMSICVNAGYLNEKDFIEGTIIDLSDTEGSQAGSENTEAQIPVDRLPLVQASNDNSLLKTVMDNIPHAVYWKDKASVYMGCNKRFANDAGFEKPDDIIGKTDYDLPWRREESDFYRACDQRVMRSKKPEFKIREPQTKIHGKKAWLETSKIPLMKENGQVIGVIGTYEEVTEKRRYEKELRKLVNYDVLTGLPNRTLFKERLEHAINGRRGVNQRHALILMDLDHFKNVNDTLGDPMGDQVLSEMGSRLRDVVPPEQTVARLGGDEFAVLLEETEKPEEIVRNVRNIMKALSKPLWVQGREMVISASMGISVFPSDGLRSRDLLRHADVAMFDAKHKGRNNYQFFTDEMNRRTLQRLDMETKLRKAIENDDFVIYCQPIINFKTGAIAGTEALVRWQNGTELIEPNDFIPLAEESGMIIPLCDLICKKAFRHAKSWLDRGLPVGKIAVNCSALQFRQKQMVEKFDALLEETGLSSHRVELEITEGSIMDDTTQAIRFMEDIKRRGMSLAIDDFGTGYSSLSSLKNFPVDVLKIDQSFIADLERSAKDRNIVASIISMGNHLGLQVTAEGVETRNQAMILKDLNCTFMQGHFFAKPMAAEHFEAYLNQYSSKPIPTP